MYEHGLLTCYRALLCCFLDSERVGKSKVQRKKKGKGERKQSREGPPEALEHPDALLRELVDEVAHDDEHEDADEEDEVWQSAPVVQPVEHSQQGDLVTRICIWHNNI